MSNDIADQTVKTTALEDGVAVRVSERQIADEVSVHRRPDGTVLLTILVGIDETNTEDEDYPADGFAELVLPAAAWEALKAL